MTDMEQKMAAEMLRLEDGRVTGPASLRVARLPKADRGGKWEICGICDGIEPEVFNTINDLLDAGEREGAWKACLQYVCENTGAVAQWLAGFELPGVEFYLRDHAFNAGSRSAAKVLQRALNALGHTLADDGIVGPATRAAFETVWRSFADEAGLLTRLHDQRLAFYRSCRQFSTFGKGWLARAAAARDFARKLMEEEA